MNTNQTGRAPTETECTGAVLLMSRLINFFPQDAETRELIALQVRAFVQKDAELKWLTHLACNVMPKWTGLSDLRGLYCTRYRPADGIEAVCTLPGYTPREVNERAERDFFAAESADADRRLTEYRREFKGLPPAEQDANRRLLGDVSGAQLKQA